AAPGQEIVLVGRDDEDARRAAYLAAAVGMTSIAGALRGGMTSWREEKRDVHRIDRLTVPELHEMWSRPPAGDGLQVLDVREATEWADGHVPGAAHVPYHDLRDAPADLDGSRPVAVMCASGQRAAVGASLLQRHGFAHVVH